LVSEQSGDRTRDDAPGGEDQELGRVGALCLLEWSAGRVWRQSWWDPERAPLVVRECERFQKSEPRVGGCELSVALDVAPVQLRVLGGAQRADDFAAVTAFGQCGRKGLLDAVPAHEIDEVRRRFPELDCRAGMESCPG